ncbi:hypothetical protein EB796_004699 [Bugula neritina]|uniref:Uncharacterized protein n=1 Tax=Bugula neritina TaxID=10212 RepID=A0A7J7KED1_BUGNE|nr:hypothetical protein EB796_004699 [Bugula neritina]
MAGALKSKAFDRKLTCTLSESSPGPAEIKMKFLYFCWLVVFIVVCLNLAGTSYGHLNLGFYSGLVEKRSVDELEADFSQANAVLK